jgi:phage-related protein
LRRHGSIAIIPDAGRLKPVHWMGSSRADMRELPERVKHDFGQALKKVQVGLRPAEAKPLKGFGGAGVLELRSDFEGATYRAVFTIRFPSAIFVLHVFQKKSTHGIQTPRRHLALIRERLQRAEQADAQAYE